MKALTIGRFQPFHMGHLRMLEYVGEQANYVIIGMGSSQLHGTFENPFTAGERERMIRESLDWPESKYEIAPISDINDPPNWVEHVSRSVPEFDIVYTNGGLESRLFREAGHRVVEIPFFERDKYDGTDIRTRIASGDESWRELVPEGTLVVIEDVDGMERIRKLSKS